MGNKTTLHDAHERLGARMVDFGGWDMPVHYGSQIDEHHAVRRAAGMFDVSHMTVVDLRGEGVRAFLARLIANDPGVLRTPGKALYTCMLNERGGVIDDLIVYYLDETFFRLVVNAATREKDLKWINQQVAEFDVAVTERADLAMIAVQGPQARALAAPLFGEDAAKAMALGKFSAGTCGGYFVARTGYTGEDGWEIVLPADQAVQAWSTLLDAGVAPCGLGARDTLRLEAGMNLYGNDMDEDTTPLETGLTWTVAWEPAERDFLGRAALEEQRKQGVSQRQVGLLLEDRGVLRAHYKVIAEGVGEGEITSGTFSPTLERSIALARVPVGTPERCEVEVRGRRLQARVVKAPFVRNGKVCIEL